MDTHLCLLESVGLAEAVITPNFYSGVSISNLERDTVQPDVFRGFVDCVWINSGTEPQIK